MNDEPYWCKEAPNVPRVWSASSLAVAGECLRKFELSYIEGWSAKEPSLDLLFGTALHRCLEWYWKRRLMEGITKDEALLETIAVAIEIGRNLPAPERPKQAGKTLQGLCMALVWYVDQYDDDPETFYRFGANPGTELAFRFALDLISPDGEPYQIRGYLDSLRNFAGIYTVWDYKTTGGSVSDFYLDKFQIDIQNHVYTIAARILSGEKFSRFLADVIGVGVTYVDLRRQPTDLTPNELDEALLDIHAIIRRVERAASDGYYPKNTKACTFCDFKGVCSKDPVSREVFLKSDFNEKRRTIIEDRK